MYHNIKKKLFNMLQFKFMVLFIRGLFKTLK
jgi:hypothetical protein